MEAVLGVLIWYASWNASLADAFKYNGGVQAAKETQAEVTSTEKTAVVGAMLTSREPKPP